MRVIVLLAALIALFPSGAPAKTDAQAARTIRDAVASRAFLIGTWHCTFTVGSQGGSYTTVWSEILDGMWLKQTYDQPKQPKADPFRAEYFIGYNPARQTWIRFGVMTTGQYFAIRMKDTGNGDWSWKYASLFPRKTAETLEPDARFTRRSDAVYTVDGPTYPGDSGTMQTEHHVCKKA